MQEVQFCGQAEHADWLRKYESAQETHVLLSVHDKQLDEQAEHPSFSTKYPLAQTEQLIVWFSDCLQVLQFLEHFSQIASISLKPNPTAQTEH